MTSERSEFEKWVVAILGANPNWRESGDCELAWQSWQARAALATQPVEYPAGAIENGRALMGRLEQWYTFADDQGHALAMCKEWLDLKECFEHMADALNAVRGAEHDQ